MCWQFADCLICVEALWCCGPCGWACSVNIGGSLQTGHSTQPYNVITSRPSCSLIRPVPPPDSPNNPYLLLPVHHLPHQLSIMHLSFLNWESCITWLSPSLMPSTQSNTPYSSHVMYIELFHLPLRILHDRQCSYKSNEKSRHKLFKHLFCAFSVLEDRL